MTDVRTSVAFTDKRKEVFLEHLRTFGNKSHSAALTGVSPRTVTKHEAKYEHFREDVEEPLGEFLGALEASAVEKAVHGKDKIVVSAGKVVMYKGEPLTEKNFSDGIHMQLLKATDPEKYRENKSVKHEGGGGVLVVTNPTPDEWQARLDKAAAEQVEKLAADKAAE